MNFYITAKNSDGKEFVIYSDNSVRLFAQQEIENECRQRGLSYSIDEIRKVAGSGKQDKTMTKFFKHRKKHNGDNGKNFDKAL